MDNGMDEKMELMDTITSLALSMYNSKGVYALLLGSGVSRSAGIMTGWEINLDLIKMICSGRGVDCGENPHLWYLSEYKEEPNYSKLLVKAAPTQEERNLLLKKYFETTDNEDENPKRPTEAHYAIAELVKKGYVKIIITTNFDRLLESALKEINIEPTVLSTPDQIKGSLPLVHLDCVIVKINGDYRDPKIRNSEQELSIYKSHEKKLLQRIFDEYGLVVCGWSADYDIALRNELEKCKAHRFTTFWTDYNGLTDVSEHIANLRQAKIIKITSANNFFVSLLSKIKALEGSSKSQPIELQMTVAKVKNYISQNDYIGLSDLARDETENLYNVLLSDAFALDTEITGDSIFKRINKYHDVSDRVQQILINGCAYGDETYYKIWLDCLERFAETLYPLNGLNTWVDLRIYPLITLIYCVGISALYSENYELLNLSLIKPMYKHYSEQEPILYVFSNRFIKDSTGWQIIIGNQKEITALNSFLLKKLREPFRVLITSDEKFSKNFIRYEYFRSLIYLDLYEKKHGSPPYWTPLGSYLWRSVPGENYHVVKQIQDEFQENNSSWKPLIAGLFGGSKERFIKIHNLMIDFINSTGSYLHFDKIQ